MVCVELIADNGHMHNQIAEDGGICMVHGEEARVLPLEFLALLVSPARPSHAERGSGELPIVELFCTAPKTGWSRNAIMRCGFHNNNMVLCNGSL